MPPARPWSAIPIFVLIAVVIVVGLRRRPPPDDASAARSTRSAATPRPPAILGIRTGVVTFIVVLGLRSARRHRRRDVGDPVRHDQRDRRDRRDAPGRRGRGGRRRQHLRRVGDGGRRGARRAVPRLHLERAHPAAAVAVLAPGALRPGDPLAVALDAVLLRRVPAVARPARRRADERSARRGSRRSAAGRSSSRSCWSLLDRRSASTVVAGLPVAGATSRTSSQPSSRSRSCRCRWP